MKSNIISKVRCFLNNESGFNTMAGIIISLIIIASLVFTVTRGIGNHIVNGANSANNKIDATSF